jgi:hypothetical protein
MPDGVNRVRLKAVDLVLAQPIDVVGLHPRRRLRSHLVDCPAQSRAKSDGPPIFSCAQHLKSVFRPDINVCCTTALEQTPHRLDVSNAIPGIERTIKVWPLLLDRRLPA